jgi:hypothetical protein
LSNACRRLKLNRRAPWGLAWERGGFDWGLLSATLVLAISVFATRLYQLKRILP